MSVEFKHPGRRMPDPDPSNFEELRKLLNRGYDDKSYAAMLLTRYAKKDLIFHLYF